MHIVRIRFLKKTNGFKKLCGSIIFSLLVSNAYASDEITLAKAIEWTLAHNPELSLYRFQEQALQGEMQTAIQNPGFEINTEIENFAGNNEMSGVDQAETTVALSSVVELGNKRQARKNVVAARQAQFDQTQKVKSLDLLSEVTRQYIEVLQAQAQLKLSQQAYEFAQDTLRSVQRRASSGAAGEVEVLRAQAALAQMQIKLESEKNSIYRLYRALAAFWGETKPAFTHVRGDLFAMAPVGDFDELYDRAQQNTSVQALATVQRLQDAELQLTQTQSNLDVRWSIGARQFQETDNVALVAGLSIPLFAGQRNQGALQSAEAIHDETLQQQKVVLLNLHTQLFDAFHNRKNAVETVHILKADVIPMLEKALTQTRQAYERGRYSYLEWVAARQELLVARKELIDTATAALLFQTTIEQLTAEPLLANFNK